MSRQLGEHGWQSVLCFLASPPEPVRRFLHLPNVSLEVLPNSWALRWQPARDLARILRRHRPRILHLHFTGFLGPYPWLARLCSVEQVFFTDQTSRPEGHAARRAPLWKRALTRLVNRPITRVISPSRYGHNCLTGLGVLPSQRFAMIYNSVDPSRVSEITRSAAQFRRQYSIPPDRAVVAQVSWIIPEKGIADLLQAAHLVLARNPKAHFVIVGDGAYRAQYSALALQMGLANHVTWTGLLQDPFQEGVYAAADVVCQLSRWEEVFGCVIAEAMAYSKPVVATRVGGIPELVEDGVSGFLVPRGDAVTAADRILRLLEDPPLREQMGRAGRQTVETRFNLPKNVAQLLELYGFCPPPGGPRSREIPQQEGIDLPHAPGGSRNGKILRDEPRRSPGQLLPERFSLDQHTQNRS